MLHSLTQFAPFAHSIQKKLLCVCTRLDAMCVFFPFCRAVCASALYFFRKVHFMYSFASSVSICSIARARIERNRETQPPNQLQHFQMNVANFSLVGFFHTVNCYLDFWHHTWLTANVKRFLYTLFQMRITQSGLNVNKWKAIEEQKTN